MKNPLPIDPFLPAISQALAAGKNIVLTAEPGSGKTTRAPVSLLNSEWLKGKKIIMLEPRRLAAKAAASFIAAQRGQKVGQEIGFRIRGESRAGPSTRLEVVTEGLLTRMIQSDPALEDVGLVVFDEFHERSIHADLSLALVLDAKGALRPDLRVMVMSATIDADTVAKLLGDAEIISCPGRQFPVEIRYGKQLETRFIDNRVVEAVQRAHSENEGDILVFLPGRAEIHRIAEKLSELPLSGSTEVVPLHSDIRGDEQDRILSPREGDRRRIILATNVAETSVTIPRVRVVVDSGLLRVPRFNPRRGMAGLETVAVSRASAAQRAGRAGREAPGACYRLWSEQDESSFAPYNQPEINYTDLSALLLELAAWGESNPEKYRFLTPPPASNLAQARELLKILGALDEKNLITPHGKALLRLALPPRLAHMLLIASDKEAGGAACELAALLEEPLPSLDRAADSVVSNRLDELHSSAIGRGAYSKNTVRRIEAETERLRKLLQPANDSNALSTGALVALAYPERVAKRREAGGTRFLMRSGSGGVVFEGSPLARHEYLAVAHLDGLGENARIYLAEPIDIEEIREIFNAEITRQREVRWVDNAVRAREVEALGALILSERAVPCSDEEAIPKILSALREGGIALLPFGPASKSLLERVEWLRAQRLTSEDLPDLSAPALTADLESWLGPFLPGVRSLDEMKPEVLHTALTLKVNRGVQKLIDDLAPTHLMLPSGRAAPISYEGPRAPSVSGRLQEMFGQAFTPRIANGAVPLTIELLSPAGRPLQVTSDLESFWTNSYQEVRKEMAGRYPKHSWPLDPRKAEPTQGAKRRK
ncbi:MAG: ATP-dependent helicase HrpB [Deltaproteobacteria bacterium]|nr:ATP-dependent helicase HrpB [Deltaproteobacteria bacterium]